MAAPPARPSFARARWRWLLGAALLLGAAVGGAVLLRPPPAPAPSLAPPAAPAIFPPAGAPPVIAPPVAATPAPPGFPVRSADEAAILADRAETLTVFRFAPEPSVIVLDFPSLEQQGRMLDRVAALEEKAGLPRDRVLDDAALAAAIRSSGATVGSYYYGHDYRAAELVRFFALADRDHVALAPEEERLRALLRGFGWFAPGGARGALISLSRQGADPEITPAARATILHHELSHGAFFAEPAYADYTRAFWRGALTAAERDAVRRFLGWDGYDTADEELMLNEMQAYLMFTDDPHFFLPSNVGMTEARRAALRAAFRRDLPIGWLRDAMPPPAVPAAAATTTERRALGAPTGSRQPAAAHR
jgi:hypothetical protein